jgi:hypothetical protein
LLCNRYSLHHIDCLGFFVSKQGLGALLFVTWCVLEKDFSICVGAFYARSFSFRVLGDL